MQIAVGGCLAQKDRDDDRPQGALGRRRLRHAQHRLAAGAARARPAQRGGAGRDPRVPRGLPVDPAHPARVRLRRLGVHLRGLQQHLHLLHRPAACAARRRTADPATILAEVEALVGEGAIEVTLLGQNVNTYGVEFGDRGAFAQAAARLRRRRRARAGPLHQPAPGGLHRRRPRRHGRDAERDAQLHMPLQSGSDRMLKAMRRSYRARAVPRDHRPVRAAVPDAAITTDIIVGFPGETEEDFQATLDVVEAARFAQAFTFQYSQRPGTPAAALPDQLPKAVVQERYERLVALQERISWEENRRQEGRALEVLVAEGEGRKDGATAPALRPRPRQPARALRPSRRPTADGVPRPGDVATVEVTYGAPHHLVADAALAGGPFAVRRTRAGDAWERRSASGSGRCRPSGCRRPPPRLSEPWTGAAEPCRLVDRGRRPDRERQVGSSGRGRAGAGRRGRQRRRLPALPRYGHRHGEAHRRRSAEACRTTCSTSST